MAYNDGPFGMDPDDFDRFARDAGESLRGMFAKFVENQASPFTAAFTTTRDGRRTRPEPETAAAAGNGVWAIIARDGENARVEQVFPTEIEALRANQHNTDDHRRVRFLPYGIAISALED